MQLNNSFKIILFVHWNVRGRMEHWGIVGVYTVNSGALDHWEGEVFRPAAGGNPAGNAGGVQRKWCLVTSLVHFSCCIKATFWAFCSTFALMSHRSFSCSFYCMCKLSLRYKDARSLLNYCKGKTAVYWQTSCFHFDILYFSYRFIWVMMHFCLNCG